MPRTPMEVDATKVMPPQTVLMEIRIRNVWRVRLSLWLIGKACRLASLVGGYQTNLEVKSNG